MMKIFLDTSTLNKIVESADGIERLKLLTQNGQSQYITSILVLQELLLTPTLQHRVNLAKCFLDMVSRITKSWNQLIREELQAFLREDSAPSPFLDESEEEKQRYYAMRAAAGEVYDPEKFCLVSKQENARKRKALNRQKELYKRDVDYIKKSGQMSAELYGSNFEDFCGEFQSEWPNQLKERFLRGEAGNFNGKVDRIIKGLDRLPHARASLRIVPAWKFSERDRKPKRNDRDDWYHMVCAATATSFVCEEVGLKEIFNWVYPEKNFLNLEGFLKKSETAKTDTA